LILKKPAHPGGSAGKRQAWVREESEGGAVRGRAGRGHGFVDHLDLRLLVARELQHPKMRSAGLVVRFHSVGVVAPDEPEVLKIRGVFGERRDRHGPAAVEVVSLGNEGVVLVPHELHVAQVIRCDAEELAEDLGEGGRERLRGAPTGHGDAIDLAVVCVLVGAERDLGHPDDTVHGVDHVDVVAGVHHDQTHIVESDVGLHVDDLGDALEERGLAGDVRRQDRLPLIECEQQPCLGDPLDELCPTFLRLEITLGPNRNLHCVASSSPIWRCVVMPHIAALLRDKTGRMIKSFSKRVSLIFNLCGTVIAGTHDEKFT